MENSSAFKKANPITARPIKIAYTLFHTLKKEKELESSDLLTELIYTYAKKHKAEGILGSESTELLDIWVELENLGTRLNNVDPVNSKG